MAGAQILEAMLGKIAAKTEVPYLVEDFADPSQNLTAWVMGELSKHGLKDRETLTDPVTDATIPGIAVGNRFIMKLHHVAESKLQGRATGAYTAEDAPAKAGKDSAKRVGMLELNALLSHGAYNVAADASVIRGQKNEDYWRQVMSGYPPPTVTSPFVYNKFLAQLQGRRIGGQAAQPGNPSTDGHGGRR